MINNFYQQSMSVGSMVVAGSPPTSGVGNIGVSLISAGKHKVPLGGP